MVLPMRSADSTMLALKVVGPYKGASGYDRMTREVVRALVQLGVEIELQNLPFWSHELPTADRELWFDELSSPVDADIVLQLAMPSRAIATCGKRSVNFTMFEASRIPTPWVELSKRHDLLIVPTEASRRAFVESGVPASLLRLCPLGVDVRAFAQPATSLALVTDEGRPLTDYRTRFLNIAELRPRKNHLGLLHAWMQATRRGDDAALLLKTNALHPSATEDFLADVDDLQRRQGRSLAEAAPILFLAECLPDSVLRGLYASATHYISMSHGEGWDLPMMEAAVSGLELIAPRHTACAEYLGEDDAFFVPSQETPAICEGRVGAEDRAFFDGLFWWTPDEAVAAKIIRAIVDGTAPPRRSPKERLARDYGWDKVAERLSQILFGTRDGFQIGSSRPGARIAEPGSR